MVDAQGEGWELRSSLAVISPFALVQRWSKRRIVELFDTSLNARHSGLRYPYGSLGNRRLETVVGDVVDLVTRAGRIRRRAATISDPQPPPAGAAGASPAHP